jgi:mRNA-degrading endonuclease YafQ of YafQ-DinJ toxin-antitoxin module
MFEIEYTLTFLKVYKKSIQKNKKLAKAFEKAINILTVNPFHTSLNTHKVDTKNYDGVFSSKVTGDWRIAWVFDELSKKAIIILLEAGTHSGSNQIYKKSS